MEHPRVLRAVALGVVLASVAPAARACPPATADDTARLATVRGELAHAAHRGRVWVWGWGIGIVGATAIDLALIPILGDTRSNRIDFGLGAATTIIGIVPLLLLPPKVIAHSDALEAKLRAHPDDTCALLDEAEHDLAAAADDQRTQRAWYFHAGNVVLNAGVTLLFGAFHHWTSGVLNGIGGAIVGEAIIFTEPTDLVGADVRLAPTLTSDRAGLAFTWHF